MCPKSTILISCLFYFLIWVEDSVISLSINNNKNHTTQANSFSLNCSQYKNDEDIVRQLSFYVTTNLTEIVKDRNSVLIQGEDRSVTELIIVEGTSVPIEVFCFKRLKHFLVYKTPFIDNAIPDALVDLKELENIWIYDTSIVKITEKFGEMKNLLGIIFKNCSLTKFPNLSQLENLIYVDVIENPLSNIDGIRSLDWLQAMDNLFQRIPQFEKPETTNTLAMNNNPLNDISLIGSFINLEQLYLNNCKIESIPSSINKLQRLQYATLANNQLTSLPEEIYTLSSLQYIDISGNRFSSNVTETIRQRFKASYPNGELII